MVSNLIEWPISESGYTFHEIWWIRLHHPRKARESSSRMPARHIKQGGKASINEATEKRQSDRGCMESRVLSASPAEGGPDLMGREIGRITRTTRKAVDSDHVSLEFWPSPPSPEAKAIKWTANANAQAILTNNVWEKKAARYSHGLRRQSTHLSPIITWHLNPRGRLQFET